VPERGKNPKSLTDQLMGIMAASTRPWDGRESEGLAGATFTKPVIRSAFQPPNFEFTHFSYVLQGRLPIYVLQGRLLGNFCLVTGEWISRMGANPPQSRCAGVTENALSAPSELVTARTADSPKVVAAPTPGSGSRTYVEPFYNRCRRRGMCVAFRLTELSRTSWSPRNGRVAAKGVSSCWC
jgi:hypothetical protein